MQTGDFQIQALSETSISHLQAFYQLWNAEYPDTLTFQAFGEFQNYLHGLADVQHFVAIRQSKAVGWAMKFTRENRRWFLIIVDHAVQQLGLGSALIQHIFASETEIHGWVIDKEGYFKPNGEVYCSPLPFYLKQGFLIHPDERLETAALSAVRISWTAK